MKSKEELDALKEEVASVNEKLKELTPEELEQVNGGTSLTTTYTASQGLLLLIPNMYKIADENTSDVRE